MDDHGTRRIAAVLALATIGIAVPAFAQDRGVDIERFTPALDQHGFLGLQATRTPGPGSWNFNLWTSVSTNPLILRNADGSETDVIDLRVTGNFQFQVGLPGGRLALGIDQPLVLHQDADGAAIQDGGPVIASNAPGDPRLALRYRFLGEDSRVERERNEGPGVALHAATTLPLGDEDALGSEHAVTTELQTIADFHVLGAGVGAMLGWRHRFETRTFSGVTFRDELEFAAGLKIPIPVTRDFLAVLEVRGVTDAGSPFDQATTAVEGDLGLRLRRGDVALTAGVGNGWTGGVGSPSFRALFGLTWAPRVRDADDDRISDDEDECPYLPEDYDGFQDEDGCLDPDNDNDLIPDRDDRCPNEQAEEFRDEDEDGCTDPLDDGDDDGVADSEDACPSQPEDRDDHQDDDGCPDPDNDGDGVLDADDQCRDEAEDRDGHADEDGCPDPDNDGDGRPDADDQCPDGAEDVDEFEDEDGCPDPDNDRDGVVDADDRCADGAENINGVTDDDGCPDRGGRSLWRVEQAGTAEERLNGTIRFAADHTIPQGAQGAVAQLARQLVSRWPHRYRVQIASSEAARRTALTAALVERGVPEGRIDVVTDESVRGARVVVVRAPVEEPNPQPTPEPEPTPPSE